MTRGLIGIATAGELLCSQAVPELLDGCYPWIRGLAHGDLLEGALRDLALFSDFSPAAFRGLKPCHDIPKDRRTRDRLRNNYFVHDAKRIPRFGFWQTTLGLKPVVDFSS